MAKHRDLKCWTKYFDCVWDGTKTFEFRVNDRAYQVGDTVTLRDYDKNTSTFKTRRCGVSANAASPHVLQIGAAVNEVLSDC